MATLATHTPARRSRRAGVLAAAAVGACVALLASACGESQADKDAAQYADSFCTTVTGWETHITGIASRLDTGNPASVTRTKLNDAATSTVALVNQIHALPVPSVDGADEAKQSIDGFVGDSLTTVASVKAGSHQLQSYGNSAQNVATVVLPLSLQLEHLVTEGKTTVSDLQAIKGPFKHAFKNSDACKALRPSDSQS